MQWRNYSWTLCDSNAIALCCSQLQTNYYWWNAKMLCCSCDFALPMISFAFDMYSLSEIHRCINGCMWEWVCMRQLIYSIHTCDANAAVVVVDFGRWWRCWCLCWMSQMLPFDTNWIFDEYVCIINAEFLVLL